MSHSKEQNFALENFLRDLYNEVESLTYAEEGGVKEEKFAEYCLEILADAGEMESTKLCTYIKPNRFGNIDQKINAYGLRSSLNESGSEVYETIDLIICLYKSSTELYTVKKGELTANINYLKKFVNTCLKGYLEDIDESHEAHTLGELIRRNNSEIDRINFFIVSNGIINHDPPKNLQIKSFEEIPLLIHVWDLERFHRLYQSKNNREPISINFKDITGEAIPSLKMPVNNQLYECYLCIIPGKVLATLYRNYSTRLLENNVRAFLQQTRKVNKGIRETIRHNPVMFLPYNNGLAVTGSEVVTEKNSQNNLAIVSIKDFQIVNGGQTTASLFHTEKKYKADLSDIYVQMKLTIIRDEEIKTKEVPNISRYANSQNKVSELDLSSNHKYLIRLEELSRTTYAIDPLDHNKQSIWYFERVNGQYREALNKESTPARKRAFELKYPKFQRFVKSEIAKYLNIWHQLPHIVSRGSQKNYITFMKSIEKEFGGKKQPGRIYFEDLIANAILFKTADRLFGRKNQNPIGENTNIRSYTINYGLALLHYLTNNNINLGKIWKDQVLDEAFQQELRKILKHAYDFLVSDPDQLISEMAKKEDTWNRFQRHSGNYKIEYIEEYLISEKEKKVRYAKGDDNVEITKKTEQLQRINSLGLKFWTGLYFWTYNNKNILSEYQENIAEKIKYKLLEGKELNQNELNAGGKIIQKLESEGISPEEIKVYSKVEEKQVIDITNITNRLLELPQDEWDRAIALGEQTKVLDFKELTTLRAVKARILKKEAVDIKRLEMTKNSFDKLKRFGIKY